MSVLPLTCYIYINLDLWVLILSSTSVGAYTQNPMETRAQSFDEKVVQLFPSGLFGTLEGKKKAKNMCSQKACIPLLQILSLDHFMGKWQIKGSCFCLAFPGRIVLGNLKYHKGLYSIDDDSISIDLQNINHLTNALCQLKSKKKPQQVFYKLQDDEGNILKLHFTNEGSTTSIYFQLTKKDSRYICMLQLLILLVLHFS